jgi:uncharacterized protein
MTDSMFHDGHRALQDRFDGRRVADALEKHLRPAAFKPEHVATIEEAAFFFLATAHADSVDCSFKGGPPGFVRVTGPAELEWPDFDGNSMYRSLGNIQRSPNVGLLFIRFGSRPARLRVNGPAEILYDHPRLADYAGAKTMVRLHAREIFPNCPRYIPDLAAGTPSPYWPDADGPGAKPGWKDFDFLRPTLPRHDPHRRQQS